MNRLPEMLTPDVLFAALIPFAGIVLSGVVVFLVLHYKHLKTEKTLETIRHLADRGMPVPPELLDPKNDDGKRQSSLVGAITTIGAGVGLIAMFAIMGVRILIGVGVMVVCVGAAQLLGLWIESRRNGQADDSAGRPGG